MCLYPKKIANKRYQANEKNQGIIPDPPIIGYNDLGIPMYDQRVLQVEVPCGQCMECRQSKAREWTVRLSEELKSCNYPYFITLTYSPEELQKLLKKTDLKESNAVAGYALRHALERYRKDYKKSIKHWFITELGHEGTERIHMHGILFADHKLEFEEIERKGNGIMANWKYWKYGIIFVGDYVNQATIMYIAKYITKLDTDHKGFVGEILCSPGIGKEYIERENNMFPGRHQYKPKNTVDWYTLNNGSRVKMPKYYINKFLNEDERQEKWREFMDTEKTTIDGVTYLKSSKKLMSNITEVAREKNTFLEYGDNSKEWRKKDYNITRRMLQQIEREKSYEYMRQKVEEKLKKQRIYEQNELQHSGYETLSEEAKMLKNT